MGLYLPGWGEETNTTRRLRAKQAAQSRPGCWGPRRLGGPGTESKGAGDREVGSRRKLGKRWENGVKDRRAE